MVKTKLDETYIFKISIKMQFFWCNSWNQNSVFRVSVTIEPGRSLLQFVATNCLTKYVWNVFIFLTFINKPLSKPQRRNVSICRLTWQPMVICFFFNKVYYYPFSLKFFFSLLSHIKAANVLIEDVPLYDMYLYKQVPLLVVIKVAPII